MKILLLGGTGFLGKYLVKELALSASKIFILTRDINSNAFSQYSNVELVKGDITDLEVIKDPTQKKLILSESDIIIHAAALYKVNADYEELYIHNVVGTQNVLHLLNQAKLLKAFYYISTIAVADEQRERLEENSLPERDSFKNNYSKTKYYAEKLVREYYDKHKKLPIRIIRPGMIIGDSQTGYSENINGPYYVVNFLKKFKNLINKIAVLPLSFNPDTILHLIPVDHVANFIYLIISRDQYSQEIKTFHLICSDPPSISDFLNDISQELGLKTKFYPMANNKAYNFILPYIKIPKEIIPFMFSTISYDKTYTLKDLPELKNSKYADFKRVFFLK